MRKLFKTYLKTWENDQHITVNLKSRIQHFLLLWSQFYNSILVDIYCFSLQVFLRYFLRIKIFLRDKVSANQWEKYKQHNRNMNKRTEQVIHWRSETWNTQVYMKYMKRYSAAQIVKFRLKHTFSSQQIENILEKQLIFRCRYREKIGRILLLVRG